MNLLPLLLLIQTPASTDDVVKDASADPAQDVIPEAVVLRGRGIEAPEQPTGRSSSTFERTPRTTPLGNENGFYGRIQTPVSSLVGVRGMEDNVVTGYGVVDGLAGTGDSGELAKQMMRNILLAQGINIDTQELASKNLAVVRVEASIPAGMKPGQRIDARVSCIGDATSLLGGTLNMTELLEHTGQVVYSTAAGPVTVGGFSAGGEAASATKNHVTVGMLPLGGKIEREVPTRVVSDHGFIYLDVKSGQSSFGNMVRITEAINRLYPGVATTLTDGKTVRVTVLDGIPEEQHIKYLDSILRQEIESDNLARVVINERTGVIVMGGDVRLRPGAIAHGNLVVTIAETAEASQPGAFSTGDTETLDRTDLAVTEDDNALVLVPGAVTLREVVEVLNVLGATPRDMMSILSAMSDGGLLVAEIRRM